VDSFDARGNEPVIDRPIKAILFDMYGTLLFEEGGLEFRYEEVARRAGLDVDAFIIARDLSMPESLTGAIPDAVVRAGVILKDMGLEPTEAQGRRLVQAEEDTRLPAVHLYPTTIPTLRALRKEGYGLGLVSDCTYFWRPVLRRMDLETRFDAITLSCEAGTTKPDPRMYLTTCEALGAKPEECVFVGDGGSNEMQGARALNMVAVLIDQEWGVSRESEHLDHDFCIGDLSELLELLPPKGVENQDDRS
jgi:putative hydrolase of the HAD superfamily